MAHFNYSYNDFFKKLAANNNREWFNENKTLYENHVKKPFYAFTEKVIEAFQKFDSEMALSVKNAVFRLHRDIRFSKDKTPYKLHMAAVIAPKGRKDFDNPGVYYHFGPGKCHIGSGYYFIPDKERLMRFRKLIAQYPAEVEKLLTDKNFFKFFPKGIVGEKNKIVPKELKDAAAKQPLIFNKQFYYMADYEDDVIFRDDLVDFVLTHFNAAKGWNDFFYSVIA